VCGLAGATAVRGKLALGARLEGDAVLALKRFAVVALADLGRGGSLVLLRRRHALQNRGGQKFLADRNFIEKKELNPQLGLITEVTLTVAH
jgi:hypothetical protein